MCYYSWIFYVLSVIELTAPPDLNQARVNKCLIALVIGRSCRKIIVRLVVFSDYFIFAPRLLGHLGTVLYRCKGHLSTPFRPLLDPWIYSFRLPGNLICHVTTLYGTWYPHVQFMFWQSTMRTTYIHFVVAHVGPALLPLHAFLWRPFVSVPRISFHDNNSRGTI